MINIVEKTRVLNAKRAFSVRRVPLEDLRAVSAAPYAPQTGDVILARVTDVGRLKRLELPTGRKAALYPDDEVIVAYGNRYAPDAYEAKVPESLGPCDLAAAGGVAAEVLSANANFADHGSMPTGISPIGVFVDRQGHAVNLNGYKLKMIDTPSQHVAVIGVCGASMNSGKTTTAAGIIRGFTKTGLRVGGAKITGTGSGGDLWKFLDAGAVSALDFTDAGMSTTYLADIQRIVEGAYSIVDELARQQCDVIVMEIADGVLQGETRALLEDRNIQGLVDRWVYTADGAASAAVGVRIMSDLRLPIAAASGTVTASPLALREAKSLVNVPFADLATLRLGDVPRSWLDQTAERDCVAN